MSSAKVVIRISSWYSRTGCRNAPAAFRTLRSRLATRLPAGPSSLRLREWRSYQKEILMKWEFSCSILYASSMRMVLLLPGWLESLKMYGGDANLEICIDALDERSASADYIIGVSLGALVAPKNINRISGKIILVNPPLPKRSIFTWFVNWLRFLITEGLLPERQRFTRNPIIFIATLVDCIKLLTTDFSKSFD